MPGVPSYRGCNACRRQKKKCDQAKPSCSRCTRLQIPCVGIGNLRFAFKDQSQSFLVVNNQAVAKRSAAGISFMLGNPSMAPCNANSLLVSKMVSLLYATNIGQDINCAGTFLPELPMRLGHNAALDASAAAFASTMTCIRSKSMVSEPVRDKYVTAIKAVQTAVAKSSTAYTVETLCSILLIASCQSWMAASNDLTPSHGMGMGHLLDVLLDQDPRRDMFLFQVVRTATNAVVLESMFNPSVQIQPWIHKLTKRNFQARLPVLNPQTLEVHAKKFIWLPSMDDVNLLLLPDLFRQPNKDIRRIQELYTMSQEDYRKVSQYRNTCFLQKDRLISLPPEAVSLLGSCDEIQSILLAVGIALNTLLRDAYPHDLQLKNDIAGFFADTVTLAEDLKMELPMGAVYLPLTLVAAWLASDDATYQARLKQLFEDYKGGYSMSEFIRRVSHWREAPQSFVDELSWFPRPANSVERPPGSDEARSCGILTQVQPHNSCCFL